MGKFRTYSFEKLDAWQLGRTLKKEVYQITKNFPREELFGLTSQIRRSSCSITQNLAEGSGRATHLDKAHFTNVSYASALETIDHLVSAKDLEYINEVEYERLRLMTDDVILRLNGLYKYQLNSEESLKSRLKSQ